MTAAAGGSGSSGAGGASGPGAAGAAELHDLSTAELIVRMRRRDAEALAAVDAASPALARAVDALVERWPRGGRLIYVGAGTSGRTGVIDAAECSPTFGVPQERVVAILAGGLRAMTVAAEAAEDDERAGAGAIAGVGAGPDDVVVGLSASGSTPFTCAALEAAVGSRSVTVAVTGDSASRLARASIIPVIVAVGAEIVEGSTRLKAGTAQKLVCNTLTTAAFIRLGRVWGRHMVAVQTGSAKLRRRAVDILQAICGCELEEAERWLAESGGDLPTAVVMARTGVGAVAARGALASCDGHVVKAAGQATSGGARDEAAARRHPSDSTPAADEAG